MWLERGGEHKDELATVSNHGVEHLHTPEHIGNLDYEEDFRMPREEPYIPGPYPTMYHGRIWTMR